MLPSRLSHARRFGLGAGLAMAMAVTAQAANPPADSFLKGAILNSPTAARPDNRSETGLLDLYLVRQAQARAGAAERAEAYDDAANYNYYELLPRFSQAADSRMSISSRPILSHMLKWSLADVGYYVQQAKDAQQPAGGRIRPYAEDPGITACYTAYLNANESYPSGHAANGYTAALLLGAAMPDRGPALIARGVRYGDNRIICGVHHPIDVERGRAIARAYFAKVEAVPTFQADLQCAIEEDTRERARDAKAPVPAFSGSCARLHATYHLEQVRLEYARVCTAWPTADAGRPKDCTK
ncbi:phosphatase PAP2 family protein [Sphingobium chlorophenolicum]|uniref:Putative acid phosphatase n=1 Tax=Sphingobium chlorophenolicum TaxID=46429 RepID=A0A081RF10_SPHCR|nr:phosphatase PAP2 family protein [Sphingobium chlorophenolicum]KEQ53783.1 putative acid phosphatase [Sphingobium chlorophenolicum]